MTWLTLFFLVGSSFIVLFCFVLFLRSPQFDVNITEFKVRTRPRGALVLHQESPVFQYLFLH